MVCQFLNVNLLICSFYRCGKLMKTQTIINYRQLISNLVSWPTRKIMKNIDYLSESIQNIALHCGEIIRKHFGDIDMQISTKTAPGDLLTKVDLESDAYIRSQIEEHFPYAGIITEEGDNIEPKEKGDDEIWFCADPLDGTANYASRNPHFCVSIGILDCNHQPLCGCIYDPIYDELFYATKGKGAFLLHAGKKRQLHCSKQNVLSNAVVTTVLLSQYSKYYLQELCKVLPHIKDYRESGSSSLDLAYVGAGRTDAYYGYGPHSWDIAAGWLIATESGAIITNYQGEEFSRKNLHIPRLGILCANKEIHSQLLPIIKTFDEPPF